MLLLAIVWLVLGPILDGTVAIVRTDRYDIFPMADARIDDNLDQQPQDSYGTNFYDTTNGDGGNTYGDDSGEALYAQTASDYYDGGWNTLARSFPDMVIKKAEKALNRYITRHNFMHNYSGRLFRGDS